MGRWLAGAACAGLFGLSLAGPVLGGCAAAAGAGVGAVAVGAAIATSECYGYVDVLVHDSVTGGRACDAEVFAVRGDDVVEFRSCFYAPLTKGRWRLSVAKPGYQSVTSEIVVNPKDNCQRVVHHVSVRLDSLAAPPPTYAATPGPAAPPAAVPIMPPAPQPAPAQQAGPSSPPAAAPAPTASPVAPPATGTPTAPNAPTPGAAPSGSVQPAPTQPAPTQPAPTQPAPTQPRQPQAPEPPPPPQSGQPKAPGPAPPVGVQ